METQEYVCEKRMIKNQVQIILKHSILSLTKLRDDVTDAGLAITLTDAFQDVLDTVNHLLS